jgi:hypothetical protein
MCVPILLPEFFPLKMICKITPQINEWDQINIRLIGALDFGITLEG